MVVQTLLTVLLVLATYATSLADQDGTTGLLPRAKMPAQPKGGPLVVIDPGHGTREASGRIVGQGASGRYQGREVPEERLTLDYSMHILAQLRRHGIRCVALRTYEEPWFQVSYRGNDQEKSNKARADAAARLGAALFLRIHFDGDTDKTVRGFSVSYDDQSKYDKDGVLTKQSLDAANASESRLRAGSPIADLGVKRFSRPIYGFVYARQPAVLLELGHLSNADETALLLKPETLAAISGAVADGVADYLRAKLKP